MGSTVSYVRDVYRTYLPVVEEEIKQGHINVQDPEGGWTLLHVAAAMDDGPAVEALLASVLWGTGNLLKRLSNTGASVNILDDEGRSPLHVSLLMGSKNCTDLLIEAAIEQPLTSSSLDGVESYHSSGELEDDDDDELIPDADLNFNDPEVIGLFGLLPTKQAESVATSSSGSPASSAPLAIPPSITHSGSKSGPSSAATSPRPESLSSSALGNSFIMMNCSSSDVPAPPATQEPSNAAKPRPSWFGSMLLNWSQKPPSKAEEEVEKLQKELESLREHIESRFGNVYNDMRGDLEKYKSIMMSQIHIAAAPFGEPVIQLGGSPPTDSPVGPPPPPPPPPPPSGETVPKKKVQKKERTMDQRVQELATQIGLADIQQANVKAAVENYVKVFSELENGIDALDKMIEQYPLLIRECPLTPKAAILRMRTWEANFFKKLSPEEAKIWRKKQEWNITKLVKKDDILEQIKIGFDLVNKARLVEREKKEAEASANRMGGVVAELKELMKSRVVEERSNQASNELEKMKEDDIDLADLSGSV